NREMGLRKFELNEEEWEIAQQLRDVLKVFSDATLYFSRDSANIAMVIPAMDEIDRRLATDSLNKVYKPCIRMACEMAKRTINRYYSKTDRSHIYRIAMVLHPSYKLQYFQQAKWEPEWIEDA
ncbi:hypothetical protein K474DRAFT_1573924, partial [Panus rudis PR-1116 ss-1]